MLHLRGEAAEGIWLLYRRKSEALKFRIAESLTGEDEKKVMSLCNSEIYQRETFLFWLHKYGNWRPSDDPSEYSEGR